MKLPSKHGELTRYANVMMSQPAARENKERKQRQGKETTGHVGESRSINRAGGGHWRKRTCTDAGYMISHDKNSLYVTLPRWWECGDKSSETGGKEVR